MTTSRTRTPALSRRLVAVALTTVLGAAALTSCGGDGNAATDKPVESTSSSPTASSSSATPTPKPTPTLRPLSRFEDRPQVKVARQWAIGAAKATIANDRSVRAIKPFVTPTGLKRMQGYLAEDMGRLYPGPVPFTPLAVRDQGGKAEVPTCMWVGGFTLDPKTKTPDKAPRIIGMKFLMFKQGGKWRIDDMVYTNFDCKKTAVKGRAF